MINIDTYSIAIGLFVGMIIAFIFMKITSGKESYTPPPPPHHKKVVKEYKAPPTSEAGKIAAALKAKGITLYGRTGCPHCENQAKEFGEAFDEVDYVDCGKTPEKCQGLSGVPAWKKDGEVIASGHIPLAQISKKFNLYD